MSGGKWRARHVGTQGSGQAQKPPWLELGVTRDRQI